MRIVHLSTFDAKGGAWRSAQRLHEGLLAVGADSHMLVATKVGGAPNTHQLQSSRARLQRWAGAKASSAWMRLKRGSKTAFFSLDVMPDAVQGELAELQPDIVNLHWINQGFLRLETVGRLPRPVVWTCHDMWPMTGGCHYSDGCRNYQAACGCCPQLASRRPHDLAYWVWKRKQRNWRDALAHVVTPSRWLAECARASTLLQDVPISVIPYGLDTSVFQPTDRVAARCKLGLPPEGPLVLFGANLGVRDPRKGFDLLLTALRRLPDRLLRDLGLVIFGGNPGADRTTLPARTYPLGNVHDDPLLALAYSAADVFVAPSREDNLPNTVLEALACGTPCLAFTVGGMPDMIEHLQTGYLATPSQPADLSVGLSWLLENGNQEMRNRCRQGALARYALPMQANRYLTLYHKLTNQSG